MDIKIYRNNQATRTIHVSLAINCHYFFKNHVIMWYG